MDMDFPTQYLWTFEQSILKFIGVTLHLQYYRQLQHKNFR